MFGKGRRSPSSSPGLTLHSTHIARRRSPFGMVRALEKASDGLSSGGSRRLAVVAVRFEFERDQERFIVARGVLRDLSGRYLQTQPSQISFVYNAFGKPDLSPEFANRLKFNLSHSAGLALIAIATASDVGVDLEYIRAQYDYADISRGFFSTAEVDYVIALPSHLYAEAFFSCWTKKEAYLKACGEGLAIP